MDITRGENLVESDLNNLIERRAREHKEADGQGSLEKMWAESERKHRERRRRENLAAWVDFHLHLAGVHGCIAAEHEQRAQALLEGGGVA